MNHLSMRKDIDKLKREIMPRSDERASALEIFIKMSIADGVKMSRAELEAEFTRMERMESELGSFTSNDPFEIFFHLSADTGMSKEQLRAQYDAMKRDRERRGLLN